MSTEIPVLNRRCWWGYIFAFPTPTYDTAYPHLQQNCVFVNTPADLVHAKVAGLSMVPSMDAPGMTKAVLKPFSSAFAAMYCSGGNQPAILASVAKAKAAFPRIPRFTVFDVSGGIQQPIPVMKGVDWPCLECYVEPSESPAQMEARLIRVLSGTVPHYAHVGLIQQCYDRHGTTPQEQLCELQAVPLRLAQRFKKVTMILIFSANRADGMRLYPTLQAGHDLGFAGITGAPSRLRL